MNLFTNDIKIYVIGIDSSEKGLKMATIVL